MAHNSLSIHRHFFLPMLAIFLLIIFGHFLVLHTKQQLLGPEPRFWIYALTGFAFLLLILAAKFASLHQICLAFFLTAPIILGCSIPLATLNPEIYDLITTFWVGGSFFFFWAYANNHFSFRQAGLYYPLFIMMVIAAGLTIHNDMLPKELVDLGIMMTLISVGILAFFLYTFFRLKQIAHEEDVRGPTIDPMFLLFYRFIIGGIVFSMAILAILDKQFGLEAVQPLWKGIILIACPILSTLLFFFRGTSWRFIAYALLFTIIVTYWSLLPMISLLAPLILLLKEMSFIAVPKRSRFLTKTWVDIFFLGCGLLIGHSLLLLPNWGFEAGVIVTMLLLTTCIHIAGVRLETFCRHG